MVRSSSLCQGNFFVGAFFLAIALTTASPCLAQQGHRLPPGSPSKAKASSPDRGIQKALEAGFIFYVKDQNAAANAQFERVIQIAKVTGNTAALGQGHRGLGVVLYAQSKYAAARKELTQALVLCTSARDSLCKAETRQDLGMVAQQSGDWTRARILYRSALQEYQARKDTTREAAIWRDLGMDPSLTDEQSEKDIRRGLAILGHPGNQEVAGELLEDWGDLLFHEGNYGGAVEKLEQAESLFQQIGNRSSLASVLVSEGRIYRADGVPAQALDFYKRALAIDRSIGDRFLEAETLNALAVSEEELGRGKTSLALYESALAVARQTGSPLLVNFLLGNIAGQHLEMHQDAPAARMIEDVLSRKITPYLRAKLYIQLANADVDLGRDQAALKAANRGLQLSESFGDREDDFYGYYWRAQAENKLGQKNAALADAYSATRVLEAIRQKLVPMDFMKRGFADRSEFLFNFTINLLYEEGHDLRALALSEEARARAFGDLLASRQANPEPAGTKLAAADELEAQARAVRTRADSPGSTVTLTLRGAKSRVASPADRPRLAPALPSIASSKPFSLAQIRAFAAQNRATILSYWVGPKATLIWVVGQDGEIHCTRVTVSRARLHAIVNRLWPSPQLQVERTRRVPETNERTAGRHRLIGRGGEDLEFSSPTRADWRELYALLIRPVASYLPTAKGSLLTIEPQGPLLLLPFAALIDGHGHYLVERYCLDYTPSLSLFPYFARASAREAPPHFLLVADPANPAPGPGGTRLPPLPGAREEVSSVARMLSASEVTMLAGRDAQAGRVEADFANSTVIHLATHAIVEDASPWDSYLAFGREQHPRTTGRLTVGEIYALKLHANLVFLSACRTAMGKVSGDGIAGLTRAFIYAGASSVIASLSDVSDETTVRLVPDFYTEWLKGDTKAQALRAAQLRLMRELRAGRVKIHTAYGTFALPENPMLWASFVLEGQP